MEAGPEGSRGFDELGVDGSGGIVVGRVKVRREPEVRALGLCRIGQGQVLHYPMVVDWCRKDDQLHVMVR